jgi:hypothetical protein
MQISKLIIYFIFIPLLCSPVYSGEVITDIDSAFEVMKPSNFTREHYFCYGRSSSAFRVNSNQQGIDIERIKAGDIHRSFLPDPDIIEQFGISQNKNSYAISLSMSTGKFFAFNKGEFGGEVWWLQKNNKLKYKVINTNPKFIVKFARQVLLFSGISHLGSVQGEIIQLNQSASTGRWQVNQTITLDGEPMAIHVDHDKQKISVVTNDSLSQLSVNNGKFFLHKILEGMWSKRVHPNSIVIMKDGTIYIGLRSGVSILKPDNSGYEETWLFSKECLTQKNG